MNMTLVDQKKIKLASYSIPTTKILPDNM